MWSEGLPSLSPASKDSVSHPLVDGWMTMRPGTFLLRLVVSMAKSPVKDVSATSVDQMETIRVEFKGLFRTSMTIGFSTIVVVQLSTALVLLVNLAFESDKAAVLFGLARMLQLSLGIFIGFFIVFLGLLAAWLGI